jgi:hypothetical protein
VCRVGCFLGSVLCGDWGDCRGFVGAQIVIRVSYLDESKISAVIKNRGV